MLLPWCVSINSMMLRGSPASLAIDTPSNTCCLIICALASGVKYWWGLFPLAWFSTKKAGLCTLPMSWYSAPVRASMGFPPILLAISLAKLATCIECWKVPGASSDNLRISGLFTSLSSIRRMFEIKPNDCSITYTKGYTNSNNMPFKKKNANIHAFICCKLSSKVSPYPK